MRDVFAGNAWRSSITAEPRLDRIGKPIRRETVRPDERPAQEPRELPAPAEPAKTPDKVPAKT